MEAGHWNWARGVEGAGAAGKYYRQAAVLARSFGDDDIRVAKSDLALATVEKKKDRAIGLLKEALAIEEKRSGPESRDVAETMQRMAYLEDEPEAVSTLEKRLAIIEKAGGDKDPQVGEALRELAMMYDRQGLDEKAGQTLERSLSLLREEPRRKEEYLTTLRDTGIFYAVRGHLDKAHGLLAGGLSEAQTLKLPYNAEPVFFQKELGWVSLAEGRGEDAVAYFRSALSRGRALRKEMFSYRKMGFLNYLLMRLTLRGKRNRGFLPGNDGRSVADVPLLLDLSYASMKLGKMRDARRYFDEAAGINKRCGGGPFRLFTGLKSGQTVPRKRDFLSEWYDRKTNARVKVMTMMSAA